MALQNGVLVHGPTSWGCAVRDTDGSLHVASAKKPVIAPAARRRLPVLRGPLVLADAFALLPAVRRTLPHSRLPFERPAVLGSIAFSVAAARVLRRARFSPGREIAAGALSLLPAVLALRGPDLASYHGAEHVSIGTYENGGRRAPKEHPRCGSQLVAPLLVSSLAANVLVAQLPPRARGIGRVAGTVGAIGVALELHGWAARNPARRVARAISRPGFELQRRFSTSEPSDEQIEVADAARDACLALELRAT
jgi:uncharacterized protein YqhQ